MEHICKMCHDNPGSHSFTVLTTYNYNNNQIHLFYTKISDAKRYNDSDGIINHYTNYLNFINPELWTWIIDFEGFEMKHYLEIKTTKRLANLIKTYGRVSQILIINSNNFVKLLINITKPILSELKHKLIVFKKDDKKELENYLDSINLTQDIIKFLI